MLGRILVSGGHEFNRREGNDAFCDLIVELTGTEAPRICLLPTASGDPEDQISSFRRAFGERGCEPSAISLFRLGENPIDLRAHLLAQDAIYVGGGSMVNLLAIWRAHGLVEILEECRSRGVLIVGQSAGAMCWFEQGVTCSSGTPAGAAGLGLLPGSCCVHYLAEPPRRAFFLTAVREGRMPTGLGLADGTAVLYRGEELVRSYVAREGSAVFAVTPLEELPVSSLPLRDRRPAIDGESPDVIELRRTLAARADSGRARLGRVARGG
jgi:dipeptidase E